MQTMSEDELTKNLKFLFEEYNDRMKKLGFPRMNFQLTGFSRYEKEFKDEITYKELADFKKFLKNIKNFS